MLKRGRPAKYIGVSCLECNQPAFAKGFCKSHYQRFHRVGNPLADHRITCAVCTRTAKQDGWCDLHYNRVIKTGTHEPRKANPVRAFLRRVLHNINGRCNNPKVNKFEYYGGRGIKNELTLDDLIFLYQRDQAHELKKPSIDREDPDKNYSRENCRFIEWTENRKTHRYRFNCQRCSKPMRKSGSSTCVDCQTGFKKCKECGREITRKGPYTCPDCRRIERPCSYCGKTIVRDAKRDASAVKNKHWFCSRSEFGKWIADNFGWAAQHRARKAAA